MKPALRVHVLIMHELQALRLFCKSVWNMRFPIISRTVLLVKFRLRMVADNQAGRIAATGLYPFDLHSSLHTSSTSDRSCN